MSLIRSQPTHYRRLGSKGLKVKVTALGKVLVEKNVIKSGNAEVDELQTLCAYFLVKCSSKL